MGFVGFFCIYQMSSKCISECTVHPVIEREGDGILKQRSQGSILQTTIKLLLQYSERDGVENQGDFFPLSCKTVFFSLAWDIHCTPEEVSLRSENGNKNGVKNFLVCREVQKVFLRSNFRDHKWHFKPIWEGQKNDGHFIVPIREIKPSF